MTTRQLCHEGILHSDAKDDQRSERDRFLCFTVEKWSLELDPFSVCLDHGDLFCRFVCTYIYIYIIDFFGGLKSNLFRHQGEVKQHVNAWKLRAIDGASPMQLV